MRPTFAQYLDPTYYLWMACHLIAAFSVGLVAYLVLPGLFR